MENLLRLDDALGQKLSFLIFPKPRLKFFQLTFLASNFLLPHQNHTILHLNLPIPCLPPNFLPPSPSPTTSRTPLCPLPPQPPPLLPQLLNLPPLLPPQPLLQTPPLLLQPKIHALQGPNLFFLGPDLIFHFHHLNFFILPISFHFLVFLLIIPTFLIQLFEVIIFIP